MRIIRAYPVLREKKDDAQASKVTQNYSGMPGGGGVGRSTEQYAMRQLPMQEEVALEAVESALEQVALLPNAEWRLKAIKLYHWRRLANLEIVAHRVHASERTVRRWNKDFVMRVARAAGYMD